VIQFLKKLFKSQNERELERLWIIVKEVNNYSEQMSECSDRDLRALTDRFKKRLDEARRSILSDGDEIEDQDEREAVLWEAERKVIEEILPEAFAVAREVADRRLGLWKIIDLTDEEIAALEDKELASQTADLKRQFKMSDSDKEIFLEADFYRRVRSLDRKTLRYRSFDVQVIGGLVLHEGNIAEMKTGEGKTLAATMPVYLNSLAGRGVHLVTVNDYLAKRDAGWMGPIYHFLGMRVAAIAHESAFLYDPNYYDAKPLDEKIRHLKPITRREAYEADIIYGTNNEFGFDYLRDNMAFSKEQLVQRDLHYAIVDEVDSILIDEARTPLIISGPADKPTNLYYKFAGLVRKLRKESDYEVDEKARTVTLTEGGISRVEKMLGIENLYDARNTEISHHLLQALKALNLFKRDYQYVVKDGQVIIVDDFTGRLMLGRRYSQGLHQAIEAKEGVKIEQENQTLATITLQNYFRMYRKLAGMTGTAATEAKEFTHIYGLGVVVVPTNEPMVRIDCSDVIYRTEPEKYNAVADEISYYHERKQPVLVGTVSIEKSELLGKMLRSRGVKCNVLNAKYHEKEAQIISEAGQDGAVTIATNMAGRGTDIILGSNVIKCFSPDGKRRLCCLGCREDCPSCSKNEKMNECRQDVPCGLHIIGTERHESRRIDNQLRGRSGRQGDPGSSRFFLSLEDDLMRLFGSDRISGLMERMGMEEGVPIEHTMVTRAIEHAQKRVEERNFSIRKHVLEYDDVMNHQREVIYNQRRKVLFDKDLRDSIVAMIEEVLEDNLELYMNQEIGYDQWDFDRLAARLNHFFMLHLEAEEIASKERDAIREMVLQQALEVYDRKTREFGPERMRDIEKYIVLGVVDHRWKEHLMGMDNLEEGIGLRAYGQRDPLIEFKIEGFQLFEAMIDYIKEEIIERMFRVQTPVERKREEKVLKNLVFGRGKTPSQAPEQPKLGPSRGGQGTMKKVKKVSKNAPCPCGSGKKFKKCCGSGVTSGEQQMG